MTTVIGFILLLVIGAISVSMIVLTLSLNTKSEGLGAAITGSAGDSYRGAVGVEEKKRRLLSQFGYAFLIVTFFFALIFRNLA